MPVNILLIKNMVCYRCVLAVEDILKKESIDFKQVLVGEIFLTNKPDANQQTRLVKALEEIGFELIENHVGGLIEKIKSIVIKRARNEVTDEERKTKLSHSISAGVNNEYTYLSSLFSSVEGRTIENYFIEQRIEKAKELLVYGQMTLSEIAFELEYSSVAHLSSQFKKITGLTPTYFKQVGDKRRKSLDHI